MYPIVQEMYPSFFEPSQLTTVLTGIKLHRDKQAAGKSSSLSLQRPSIPRNSSCDSN